MQAKKDCVTLHTQSFRIAEYWHSLFFQLKKDAQLQKVLVLFISMSMEELCSQTNLHMHSISSYWNLFDVGIRLCILSYIV